MAWDPVLLFPVSFNPFPVFVVVAVNPDLFARRVGAYVNGCEDGQKGQADTKNQHFHFLIPSRSGVVRLIHLILP
jgi:hypothetical protein